MVPVPLFAFSTSGTDTSGKDCLKRSTIDLQNQSSDDRVFKRSVTISCDVSKEGTRDRTIRTGLKGRRGRGRVRGVG